jgi:hypothetical protein
MSSNDDSNPEVAGCGCGLFLGFAGIVWLLSGYIGFWKATYAGLIAMLLVLVIGLMGIIPILGQWLAKSFAQGIIIWGLGKIHVNPGIQLVVPKWINFVMRWILGEKEVSGSLASYIFSTGYTLSVIVSISIIGGIILNIIKRRER